jgi:hypothetical protein
MSAGSARLTFTLKTLRERWEAATEQWSDQVSRDFEKNHLVPLEHQSTAAIRAMEKMSDILSKLRQDCAS